MSGSQSQLVQDPVLRKDLILNPSKPVSPRSSDLERIEAELLSI